MPAEQTVNLVNYPQLERWQALETIATSTIPNSIVSIYHHA